MGALSHITDAQHNQLTSYYLLPAAVTILHLCASSLRFVLSDLPSAKSRLPDADTILHLYASSLLIFLRYMLLIVPESAEIHREHLI
jgi:hypothetical protein